MRQSPIHGIFFGKIQEFHYGTQPMPQSIVQANTEILAEKDAVDFTARLSVSLPRSLYRNFRLHALDQDTTLSALIARLIRKELGETENQA